MTDIVLALGVRTKVPEKFQNPDWRNSSLREESIYSFLTDVDIATVDYYSKNHLSGNVMVGDRTFRDVLNCENVYMVNIIRNIPDMLISRFYHESERNRPGMTFKDFFDARAAKVVKKYVDFHSSWHMAEKQPYLLKYEHLHSDFSRSVRDLASYLGLDIDRTRLEEIREQTLFRPGKSRHMRKGIVGDSRNYLDRDMHDRLEVIKAECRFTELAKAISARHGFEIA
jgi:hypothetical protein